MKIRNNIWAFISEDIGEICISINLHKGTELSYDEELFIIGVEENSISLVEAEDKLKAYFK